MKSLAFALALTAVLQAAVPARAADEPKSKLASLSAWFKNLKNGLSESAVGGKFQSRKVSSVAAVRGDEQSSVDPERPEWKTSTKSEKMALRKEKKVLSGAVDLIISGKFEEGKAAIDAFEKDYPKSKLLGEARTARENADLLAELRGAGAEKAEDKAADAQAPAVESEKKQ